MNFWVCCYKIVFSLFQFANSLNLNSRGLLIDSDKRLRLFIVFKSYSNVFLFYFITKKNNTVWQGRGGKKSLRHVFLFQDLVLFSKARRFPDTKNLDIYIYKNSIKTSDIGLTELVGDSTTKFEIWFRKMKPDDTWTLQSMNEDTKKAWTEEISKLLWDQAKRNREIRMAEMSSMGIGNKPCLDIRPSQNQINDRSVSFTQLEKGEI